MKLLKLVKPLRFWKQKAVRRTLKNPEPKSYEEVKDQIVQPEPEVVKLWTAFINHSDSFNHQNSDLYLSPLVNLLFSRKISLNLNLKR
jgi:2-oxoglutarate dehydrogenase E2 component (dihydrolipoamide succinyltransferase)